MPYPRTDPDAIAACHAEGLTAPETAARIGCHESTVYNWAKAHGVRFANRKVLPPKTLNLSAEARRRAAHAAAMERIRNGAVNGWTWAELMDLGYTAREAAQLRGQTIPAAYQAERTLGRKFYRIHLRNMTEQERRKLRRVQRDYGVSRNEALTIIGREDLIEARRPARDRIRAMIQRNPEAAILIAMQGSEVRT